MHKINSVFKEYEAEYNTSAFKFFLYDKNKLPHSEWVSNDFQLGSHYILSS